MCALFLCALLPALFLSCQRAQGGSASGKKLIILGIDGMDPDLLTRFMAEGKMPNFSRLAQQGSFRQTDYQHSSAESGGVVESDYRDERRRARDFRFHPPRPEDISALFFDFASRGAEAQLAYWQLGDSSGIGKRRPTPARQGLLGNFGREREFQTRCIASRRIFRPSARKGRLSREWERPICAARTAHSRSIPTTP